MLYQIWDTPEKSLFLRRFGFSFEGIRQYIDSGNLELATGIVLALNAVFIFFQSYIELNHLQRPEIFEMIEFFFSVIYMVEVVMKLLVISFFNYMSDHGNQFDFGVSFLLFGTAICSVVPALMLPDAIMRYLNILRLLRMFRLLRHVTRFRLMVAAIVNLCAVSSEMRWLLSITMGLFAIFGQQVFGGALYASNTGNFNDMFNSMSTLFAMLVNSYIPKYAKDMGTYLPQGWGWIGYVYCGLFFFVVVNIAFNIFTAFTIDVFVMLKENEQSDGETMAAADDVIAGAVTKIKQFMLDDGRVLHVHLPAQVLRSLVQQKVFSGLQEMIQKEQEQQRDALNNSVHEAMLRDEQEAKQAKAPTY
eukprot:NODE_7428_length_1579_cov_3.674931.p1 GENE.NODE_7428_length_1579_cov_3.674931~~NODE_7428_length_1579_cov_3.674931.p1  ORF type:complete len:384 (-),score=111.13 NODE_7428_length_1579_cov_3.674931:428-1510(-)